MVGAGNVSGPLPAQLGRPSPEAVLRAVVWSGTLSLSTYREAGPPTPVFPDSNWPSHPRVSDMEVTEAARWTEEGTMASGHT